MCWKGKDPRVGQNRVLYLAALMDEKFANVFAPKLCTDFWFDISGFLAVRGWVLLYWLLFLLPSETNPLVLRMQIRCRFMPLKISLCADYGPTAGCTVVLSARHGTPFALLPMKCVSRHKISSLYARLFCFTVT